MVKLFLDYKWRATSREGRLEGCIVHALDSLLFSDRYMKLHVSAYAAYDYLKFS